MRGLQRIRAMAAGTGRPAKALGPKDVPPIVTGDRSRDLA